MNNVIRNMGLFHTIISGTCNHCAGYHWRVYLQLLYQKFSLKVHICVGRRGLIYHPRSKVGECPQHLAPPSRSLRHYHTGACFGDLDQKHVSDVIIISTNEQLESLWAMLIDWLNRQWHHEHVSGHGRQNMPLRIYGLTFGFTEIHASLEEYLCCSVKVL